MSARRGIISWVLLVLLAMSCAGCGNGKIPGAAGARLVVLAEPPENVHLAGMHVVDMPTPTLNNEWPQTFPAATTRLIVEAFLLLPKDAEVVLYLSSPSGPLLLDGKVPDDFHTDGAITSVFAHERFTEGGSTRVSFELRPKSGAFPAGHYQGTVVVSSTHGKPGKIQLNWSVSDK